MIKNIFNRFKYKPIITSMFIFITCISMLFISIGISTAVELNNQINEKNSGIPTNYMDVNIDSNYFKDIDDFINIIKGIKGNFVQIDLGNLEINKEEYINIYAQYFNENLPIRYPYIYGESIKKSDIENNKRVVCIGKNIKKYTYERDGEIYFKYNTEEYLVRGIIGKKDKDSLYDDDVIFTITSIPNPLKVKFFNGGNQRIGVYGEDSNLNLNYIFNEMSEIDKDISIRYNNISEEKILYESIVSSFSMVSIFIILLGICICNMIIISYYWSKSEEREIAIKKANGFSKKQLAMEIFLVFFSLVAIAVTITIFIQYIMSLNTSNLNNFYLYISKENVIISIIICVLVSIIISILPIRNAINVSPKITLGRE